MPDTSVKAIAEMTNEEILDRLRQIIICIKSPDDIQEAGELLNELGDRLKEERTVSVSFTLNGSPKLVGAALAEIIIQSFPPEEVAKLRSQFLEEIAT